MIDFTGGHFICFLIGLSGGYLLRVMHYETFEKDIIDIKSNLDELIIFYKDKMDLEAEEWQKEGYMDLIDVFIKLKKDVM